MNWKRLKLGSATALIVLTTACSSLPERIDTLEQARAEIRTLETNPLAAEHAAVELDEARSAIRAADRAYDEGADLEIIEHHTYVAQRHLDIADQQISEAAAQQRLAESEARRNEVRLELREREAQQARQLAEQRELAARAQAARAESAEQRAEALANRLESLQADVADRGIVLTLGDILFDTDRAMLKPGADATVDELAAFLSDYPNRRVLIEGHTDARGPESYNADLSERRAGAVEDALEQRGIGSGRIQTVGLGERYPVASNQTSAGMQQNRRVEIVLSDANGRFPAEVVERMAGTTGPADSRS